MKALTCPVILEGASTRSDGSLSLRFSTPELEAASKTAFFELLNQNLKMLLQPSDNEPVELHDVKGEFDRKTPSQRLRNTLFVWWKQQNEPGDFQDWYIRRMEDLINQVKRELEPV